MAIVSLLTLIVSLGGFIMMSINLMQRFTALTSDCSLSVGCPKRGSSALKFNLQVRTFLNFIALHLGLSTTLLVAAFLTFLTGRKISGVTFWLLGCNTLGFTVATIIYYFLSLREFMENSLELNIFNSEFIFMQNAALGLLVGSILTYKGCGAFVDLLAYLWTSLLVLPLLVVLAVLAMARGTLCLAILPFLKVIK